jgi:hypothetical protein
MKQSPAEQKESSFSILPVTNPSDAVPDPHMERTDTVPAPVEFKDLNAITNKDENGETRTITATVKNGKKYKLVMKNDNSLELFVNDKKIPASEMDTYQPVIDEMEQAVEFRQKKEIEKMKKAQGEQSEKLLKLDAERMELMRKLATIDEERAKLSSEYMRKFKDHEWENAAEMNLHYDNLWKSRQESLNDEFFHFPMELKLNSEDLLHQQLLNESFNKFNTDQLFQQENNELFERQLLQENFNQFNMDQLNQNENNKLFHEHLANEKMNLFRNFQWEQQQQWSGHAIEPIIEDMLDEKIISARENLSLELNADKFVVNGKKQPAEVHKRFQEKYLVKSSDYYKYSRKNGSVNITTHVQ